MANEKQLALLKQGVRHWNAWRRENRSKKVDLRGADLRGVDLSEANLFNAKLNGADLRGVVSRDTDLILADLRGATLSGAHLLSPRLFKANLSEANLRRAEMDLAFLSWANLRGADLFRARLNAADLRRANLSEANLRETDLGGANLSEANLRGATLVRATLANAQLVDTNLTNANLTGCHIYGVSAWNLRLKGAQQKDLIITNYNKPVITVDNLEVAQFIFLLLHNEKIRDVIDTITSKAVLILGRFTPERKGILDALREELRHRNYLPILFDFEKPTSRDLTETISTLAHMARFIIADITDAKSLPQELQAIVPNLPGVPVQPLLQRGAKEYGMFEHFKRYPWVLTAFHYDGVKAVRASLKKKIIAPAEAKAKELLKG